jgi:GTP pyrophosphokinase
LGFYQEEKKTEAIKEEKLEKTIDVKKKPRKIDASGVRVEGIDNLLIRFSKCCNPVPGDEIVGFITKGRGISVHRKDCTNINTLPEDERERFITVSWDSQKDNMSYDTEISILAEDRKGLFSDISRACDDMDVNITAVQAKSSKDKFVTISLTLSITNTSQIEKVMRQIKLISGVSNVYRSIT